MENNQTRYEENTTQTAWQYLKRVEKYNEEKENPYWEGLDLDLKKAEVRPVNRSLAKEIIEEYEWLGCMPAISKYYYGIFFEDVCGGVVVFGTEYSENTGVWDKYGYTGKMILLSRGVCLHWTPKNTNSKLIMSAIKMLPEQYEIVTATIDPLAGEFGTIYQACNFHYVGSMREKDGKERPRIGILYEGKLYSSRSVKAKFGTRSVEKILSEYPEAKHVPQYSKRRYFIFRKNKKQHYKAIEHLIKPYPKRDELELVEIKNGYQKLLAVEYTDYKPVELRKFIL